ncbi:hypothetical protein FRC03_000769 [Tulasnella sp. 419]|nr:hypothetical protein FRC03_000769 [Tulasnella sp. 419]
MAGQQSSDSVQVEKSDHATRENPELGIPPKFGHDPCYWEGYVDLATKYDRNFVDRLNAQLDSLLTFAGLFSGINTGFIVLCLGLLDKTPSDTTNALFRMLLARHDFTKEELDKAGQPWSLEAVGTRSSSFLSASLACSLITSMGAVLGKQWLSYYDSTEPVGPMERRAIKHQIRMDKLHFYSLRKFLFSLTFLIQISVLLFLIGFIDYLWKLNHKVAGVVIALVSAGFVIYAYTVIVAAWDPECPFQTPVSNALRKACLSFKSGLIYLLSRITDDSEEGGTSRFDDIEEWGDEGQTSRNRVRAFLRHLSTIEYIGTFMNQALARMRAKERELKSYAGSARWILETASHQRMLKLAAQNILTLHNVKFTRMIFEQSNSGPLDATLEFLGSYISNFIGKKSERSIPEGSQSSSSSTLRFCDSPAYVRLIFLFRDSLSRYLDAIHTGNIPGDVIEDMTIYGRAVCHALVSSPDVLKVSEHLVGMLDKFTRLAWDEGFNSEVRLLVTCILNHPRLWTNRCLKLLAGTLNTIDVFALPMYIVGVSTISMNSRPGNRDEWVALLAYKSLSRHDATFRVIGLAARSLTYVRLNPGQKRQMLDKFCQTYSSDINFVSDVLAALESYAQANYHFDSYMALTEAFRRAVTKVYMDEDDLPEELRSFNHEKLTREMRRLHQEQYQEHGSRLLRAFEGIAADVSDKIQALSKRPSDNSLNTSSWLDASAEQYPGVSEYYKFMGSIFYSISDGIRYYQAAYRLRQSGMALWDAATKFGMSLLDGPSMSGENLKTLHRILYLMRAMEEARVLEEAGTSYARLFEYHPFVARVIAHALKSTDKETRKCSFLLIQEKARDWFREQEIIRQFEDATLDISLGSYVLQERGDADVDDVVTLVDSLASGSQFQSGWRRKILNAFYDAAITLSEESLTPERAIVLQKLLQIWGEMRKPEVGDINDVQHSTTYHNWHSEAMLTLIMQYVEYSIKDFTESDQGRQIQLKNTGIKALTKYVQYARKMRPDTAVQKLSELFLTLESLHNSSPHDPHM